MPDAAAEQEIYVYRACPTRKIQQASFLNTYEENGFQVSVGLRADDPQVYCLSTYFRLNDIRRFVIIDSRYNPPFLLVKGYTTGDCGVSCKTREWQPTKGSHVDWWLYEGATPWLTFEETTYEYEKENASIPGSK